MTTDQAKPLWKRLFGGAGEFFAELAGEAVLALSVCAALFGLISATDRHPIIMGSLGAAVLGLGTYGGFYLKRTWRQAYVWRASSMFQRIGLISFWVMVLSLFLGLSYGAYCDCL